MKFAWHHLSKPSSNTETSTLMVSHQVATVGDGHVLCSYGVESKAQAFSSSGLAMYVTPEPRPAWHLART